MRINIVLIFFLYVVIVGYDAKNRRESGALGRDLTTKKKKNDKKCTIKSVLFLINVILFGSL